MSTPTSETNLECPHPNDPAPGFAALPEGPQVEGFGFEELDEHDPAHAVLVFLRPVASWLAITVSGMMIMAYATFGARPPPPHIVPDPDSPAAVRHGSGRRGRRERHFTRTDVGWLQSPSPVLVTARYRNMTVEATARPSTVVFACSVDGKVDHVLPPSVLICHS